MGNCETPMHSREHSLHHQIAQTYHLLQLIERAARLERRARAAHQRLAPDDPERLRWMRIERRYATIRGNALHLLMRHARHRWWWRSIRLLRRSLYLL